MFTLQVDKFIMDLHPLGILTKVRLANSGKGAFRWLVEKVVVTSLADGTATTFPCNRWLGQGDGAEEILELVSSRGDDAPHIVLKNKKYK